MHQRKKNTVKMLKCFELNHNETMADEKLWMQFWTCLKGNLQHIFKCT